MPVIDDAEMALHRILVKIYDGNPQRREHELYMRTVNEKTFSFEEVCAAAKERGGFTGSLDDLKERVAIFLREAAHHLCDGFEVRRTGRRVLHSSRRANAAVSPCGGGRYQLLYYRNVWPMAIEIFLSSFIRSKP